MGSLWRLCGHVLHVGLGLERFGLSEAEDDFGNLGSM